jgi:hypothetical protein
MIVRDPKPAEFEALLERRRRLGQDRWDEERDGVYYMNPSPTYEHQRDTWEKLPFYARRGVEELAIVDPRERRVIWLELGADGEYREVERSRVIELTAAKLADRLDWPR